MGIQHIDDEDGLGLLYRGNYSRFEAKEGILAHVARMIAVLRDTSSHPSGDSGSASHI